MIKVDVKDYCESCGNFKPADPEKLFYDCLIDKADTFITCANSELCERLRLYLQQEFTKIKADMEAEIKELRNRLEAMKGE